MTNHAIFDRPLDAPVPQGLDQAIFGMGRFWGPERLFWQQPGVWLTEVGFAGDDASHAEVVRVIFDSSRISYDHLLQLFWENHDPTQNGDATNPHRSLIVAMNASQHHAAEASRADYDNRLAVAGIAKITTRILDNVPFWPAPPEQQQYLAKNPDAHCELKGTGVEASIPNPDPS